jgi:hypothetical protein
MSDYTLQRTISTSQAMCGDCTIDGAQYFTLEQPWRDNLEGHSCVPAGIYQLIPYISVRHGSTFCLHNPALNIYGPPEVTGVPIPVGGRSYCELHSANWPEQLEGCIAFGLNYQPTMDPYTDMIEPAITRSVDAVTAMLASLHADPGPHTLTILDVAT